MSNKLLGAGDLLVLRDNRRSKGFSIPASEMKSVIGLVGEVGYALYTAYRTLNFYEAEELTDISIAKLIGWNKQKAQKYRIILETHGLYINERHGSVKSGVTRMLVGGDTVALYNAGLPCDILNSKALNKLKKEMQITTSEEVVLNAALMTEKYLANPESY